MLLIECLQCLCTCADIKCHVCASCLHQCSMLCRSFTSGISENSSGSMQGLRTCADVLLCGSGVMRRVESAEKSTRVAAAAERKRLQKSGKGGVEVGELNSVLGTIAAEKSLRVAAADRKQKRKAGQAEVSHLIIFFLSKNVRVAAAEHRSEWQQ